MLALDWRKAFDWISTEAFCAGLHRFGLPQHVLQIMRSLYREREFCVRGWRKVELLQATIRDLPGLSSVPISYRDRDDRANQGRTVLAFCSCPACS